MFKFALKNKYNWETKKYKENFFVFNVKLSERIDGQLTDWLAD